MFVCLGWFAAFVVFECLWVIVFCDCLLYCFVVVCYLLVSFVGVLGCVFCLIIVLRFGFKLWLVVYVFILLSYVFNLLWD